MYGQGGLKLEINIPLQQIFAKTEGGLIIEGGIISSEYGNSFLAQGDYQVHSSHFILSEYHLE